MSTKLVTSRQGQSVADMANAKGISREEFQKALDNGNFAKFLDSIKLAAPKGCHIKTVTIRHRGNSKEMVLLNVNERDKMSWDDCIKWMGKVGLKVTTPDEVIAISEQLPNLCVNESGFNLSPTQIVATKEYPDAINGKCGIKFDNDRRWTPLFSSDYCQYVGTDVWFAFRK